MFEAEPLSGSAARSQHSWDAAAIYHIYMVYKVTNFLHEAFMRLCGLQFLLHLGQFNHYLFGSNDDLIWPLIPNHSSEINPHITRLVGLLASDAINDTHRALGALANLEWRLQLWVRTTGTQIPCTARFWTNHHHHQHCIFAADAKRQISDLPHAKLPG